MQRRSRQWLGAVLWLAALSAAAVWLARGTDRSQWLASMWRFATSHPNAVAIESTEPMLLAAGDPVFLPTGDTFVQVGEIAHGPLIGRQWSWQQEAEVLLYATAPPLKGDATITYYRHQPTLPETVALLIPPEKQQRIAAELRDALERHHDEVMRALEPVINASLREAAVVVEEDISAAIARRQDELDRIGARYRAEWVDGQWAEIFEQEVLPVVHEHAEPVAEELGMEMWQRISLWRFAWRYLVDSASFSHQQLVQTEWERFVSEEARPVVARHAPELIAMQQRILEDVAANPRVRNMLREGAVRALADPEVRRLAADILREALIDNSRLREVFDRHWRSEQGRAALEVASQRTEPVARRIGEIVFGTPEEGLTTEFASLLRREVLLKDRRWFILSPGEGADRLADDAPRPLRVVVGDARDVNPLLARMARQARDEP